MGLFNSSNPALGENTIKNVTSVYGAEVMTVNGTIWKTIFGVVLVFAGGFYTVYHYDPLNPASINTLFLVGLIGGFIAAMVTIFKQNLAPYTMPIYALLEGLVLGGASLMIPAYFGAPMAVVGQAILGTAATFFVMLILYRSGVITVNQKFVGVVIAATIGIGVVYLILFVMSLFGSGNFLMGTSALSIGVTAFAAVVAALNLAMDFELINQLQQRAAPKYMEWYGAFSILVTLVWLYLELLRLLSKIAASNR